jgi:hypothetical protein
LFSSLASVEHVPPQLTCPAGQVAVHWPLTQAWPLAHALKQAPQLLASSSRFRQARPHWVVPGLHALVHWPLTQTWSDLQATSHEPQ